MPYHRILSVFILLAFAGSWLPATAGSPVCDAAHAGRVAAMAGKRCECRFERGGRMTGIAPGYRWDCGILRPADRFAPLAPNPPAPDWLGPVIVDRRAVRP